MPGISEMAREDEEAKVESLHFSQESLLEFMEAYDAHNAPWTKLVEEEHDEFLEAVAHMIKEMTDLVYVCTGAELTGSHIPDIPLGPDWVGRMLNEIPLEIREAAFREVHRSNMSKLGADGNPIRREDGKVLKGPLYSPADILSIIMEYDD